MVFVPGPWWSNLGLATLTPSRDAYLLKVLTKVYFTYIRLVVVRTHSLVEVQWSDFAGKKCEGEVCRKNMILLMLIIHKQIARP